MRIGLRRTRRGALGLVDGGNQCRKIGKPERRVVEPRRSAFMIDAGVKTTAAQRQNRHAFGQAVQIVDIVFGVHQIGGEHIEMCLAEPAPGIPAVSALFHPMSEIGKDPGDELANSPVGFDDKNAGHGGSR
ncbi:MAG TPA: hypothetical protein VNF04_18390 [Stellaceae bacterium]|nr:hypothetical protein [Stellaceae bacterium]